MKRRDFIKFTSTGLAVVAVGTMADWPMFWRGSQAHASSLSLDRLELEMLSVDAEMVTGVTVPMWAFKIDDDDHEEHPHHISAARIPGPAMVALAGDRIRLRITNNILNGGTHGFAIPGVVAPVEIPFEGRADIEFTAPQPGTYVYLDPFNAPVNRMMGLHGVLVVLPNPIGNNTPYLNPTANIQALFDDLGQPDGPFPGAPWDPSRNVVWMFNVIDSQRFNVASTSVSGVSPNFFTRAEGFLPDYFTLNGKSGYFSAQHHHHNGESGEDNDDHGGGIESIISAATPIHDMQSNISFRGAVGQPILIRSINVGNFWHSPHIHGTHLYPLSHANMFNGQRTLNNNLTFLDTWSLAPGDIKELLHPYTMPPDVPPNAWPPVQERFPLVYPMHDHNEITNTAAGGNYPHGIATHWQIDQLFDPNDPALGVIFVDRAELRVKTGQLLIEGRFTVPNQHLHVHAGGPDGAMVTAHVMVDGDGRFKFRGRALKALGGRFVTLMHHEDGHTHAVRSVPLILR